MAAAGMDQVKNAFSGVKTFWSKLAPKVKKLIIVGGIAVLVIAIGATVVMNANSAQYKVLFNGITTAEAAEVYSVLQEQGVKARLNKSGQVEVPKEQVEGLIFQMAAKGYPKTAPPYDTFLNNISITSTEFEKRKVEVFQLQDRIQATLRAVDGIKNAIVNIAMPESSGLLLEEKAEPTVGVMLTLETSADQFNSGNVSTIKNLIAASIQGCKPENVVVTDASTNIELEGGAGSMAFNTQLMEFERLYAKRAEDKIKALWSDTYTPSGIKASAAYEFDTEKMKKEIKEIQPEDNGKGVPVTEEEHYRANGGIPVGGIVGEEDNTDPPTYVTDGEATKDGITEWDRLTKSEYSYVLTQIENGAAPIKSASMTVLINDKNLTAARQDEMTIQAARATGIAPENISIGVLTIPQPNEDVNTSTTVPFYQNTTFLMAVGAGMLFLCVLLIVVPILMSRKKKKKKELNLAALEAERKLNEESAQRAQAEIDLHKNKLKFEAEAQKIQDGSMTEEIRSFAKENPEMTATLIRSLLKEDS